MTLRLMKRSLPLLLALMLLCAPALAAEGHRCYLGPGTNYQYLTDLTIPLNTGITLHSVAYDSKGDVWVQVEYQDGSNLIRAYLPRKSVNGDLSRLPVEKRWEELTPEWLARPYPGGQVRLGPGRQYNNLVFDLESVTDCVIITTEGEWALVEMHLMKNPIRCWTELKDLQY